MNIINFAKVFEPTPWDDVVGPNGPQLWSQILGLLNNTGAVVAGGAVRDHLLGVEPKDIDIFVPAENMDPPPFFEGLGDGKMEEYAAMTGIDIVLRSTLAGLQVDLIGIRMDSPRALVEAFDFGINQCWFDTDIHETPWSRYDRTNNIISLMHGDRRERSLARFERLNTRHEGRFTLVDRT